MSCWKLLEHRGYPTGRARSRHLAIAIVRGKALGRQARAEREDEWHPGPARDVERKQTPYLVPWKELDEEEV